jgi:hypothetical protein
LGLGSTAFCQGGIVPCAFFRRVRETFTFAWIGEPGTGRKKRQESPIKAGPGKQFDFFLFGKDLSL